MSKSTKLVLAGAAGALCLLSALIGLGVTSAFYRPDFGQMKKQVKINIKLANREKSTRWIGPETAYWVPMSEISDHLIAAVISSEDTSFYSHQGVDFHELKEAIKHDIKEKRWARGASTLTQQVVKNVYLTQEKTLTRKFREILWAREIEKSLTKSQILCFYLNMAEWGPGIYGIRGAANHYFSKPASDLSAKESAFLAMLLPSPWRYHVYFAKKELTPWAEKRIARVLTVMNKMGYLDPSEYEVAMAEPLFGGAMGTGTEEPAGEEPEATEPVSRTETSPSEPSIPVPDGAVSRPEPSSLPEPVDPGPTASMDEEPAVEDPALKE